MKHVFPCLSRSPLARSCLLFFAALSAHPVLVHAAAYSVVQDSNSLRVSSPTGESLSTSYADDRRWAYRTPSGDYAIIRQDTASSAKAQLSTGELGTYARVGTYGAPSGAVMPEGYRSLQANAYAGFGDSFTTFGSNNTPFLWSDGTAAQFSFAIEGGTSPVNGLAVPTDPYEDGQPQNFIFTQLVFTAYQPGGIDILNQMAALEDAPEFDFDEWLVLVRDLEAKTLDRSFWYLGDYILPSDWALADDMFVTLGHDGTADLDFSFTPGGDFDWTLTLDTHVWFDASLQDVYFTHDFANTITARYQGPAGTTTYSSSGFFPGTLPLAGIPSAVPDSGSTLLAMLLGLPVMAAIRRRLG